MTLFEKAKQALDKPIVRYLLLVTAAILAMSLLISVVGLAAKIIGLALLSAVIVETLVPGSVTGRLAPVLNSMANKVSDFVASVSNFFKKSMTPKPTESTGNNYGLEAESDDDIKVVAKTRPSILTQFYNSLPRNPIRDWCNGASTMKAEHVAAGKPGLNTSGSGAPVVSAHELPSNNKIWHSL